MKGGWLFGIVAGIVAGGIYFLWSDRLAYVVPSDGAPGFRKFEVSSAWFAVESFTIGVVTCLVVVCGAAWIRGRGWVR